MEERRDDGNQETDVRGEPSEGGKSKRDISISAMGAPSLFGERGLTGTGVTSTWLDVTLDTASWYSEYRKLPVLVLGASRSTSSSTTAVLLY